MIGRRAIRLALLATVATMSMATGASLGLGFVWSGLLLQAPVVVATAGYLVAYFFIAWLLMPAMQTRLITFQWCLGAIALAVWLYARLRPETFLLEVTTIDLLVLLSIPLSGLAYRRLGLNGLKVRS